jgi:hypothetical protein
VLAFTPVLRTEIPSIGSSVTRLLIEFPFSGKSADIRAPAEEAEQAAEGVCQALAVQASGQSVWRGRCGTRFVRSSRILFGYKG